jgi:di/tricarboxylate transporter
MKELGRRWKRVSIMLVVVTAMLGGIFSKGANASRCGSEVVGVAASVVACVVVSITFLTNRCRG